MRRFAPRPGFERGLSRQPEMVAGLRLAGSRIQSAAEASAPRRGALPTGRRRHYADMFDTQAGLDEKGAVATVNNRHFTAVLIEFGSVNNPAYAPLRRAVDAMRGKAL